MKEEVMPLCPEDSDPFLVTRTNKIQQLVGDAMKKDEERERKEMLVKMRACELLLIE